MFSDKSRFCLQSDSRRTLIWRAPGTHYHQKNTIERNRYGGAGWPVLNFLFTDDNARPHHANIADECLQSEDITRMDWPAYSPDLNPIEHVWDMLGRRIAARQTPPTCLLELRRALLDEWCHIPQDQQKQYQC
ncbi:transposable element Tcb1 transposase [Trichonephila clavipes]|nr:transposable element Tcb1 transposase [Trichonephila clavipes]